MKKLLQLTKTRTIQLRVPVNSRPGSRKTWGSPGQEVAGHLKADLIRFCCALVPLIRAIWNLIQLWALVPVSGAALYFVLKHTGFPYPGAGILIGMSVAAGLLHRGTDSPFYPTRQGLILYFAIVAFGNYREISSSAYGFEDVLDITLLAKGEQITPYHWLGFACIGFSDLLFGFREFCSRSCPGHCLGNYRQRLHAARSALSVCSAQALTVVGCAAVTAIHLARLLFLKIRSAPRADRDDPQPMLSIQAEEQEQLTLELDCSPLTDRHGQQMPNTSSPQKALSLPPRPFDAELQSSATKQKIPEKRQPL